MNDIDDNENGLESSTEKSQSDQISMGSGILKVNGIKDLDTEPFKKENSDGQLALVNVNMHKNINNNNSLAIDQENEYVKKYDITEVKEEEKSGCFKCLNKKKEKIKTVSLFRLFRFADKCDVLMMIVGTICACIHGAALPCLIIVFGGMTNTFVKSGAEINMNVTSAGDSLAHMMSEIKKSAIYYAIIGAIVLVIAYLQVALWLISSYKQTFKIRIALITSVLRQEIGWFDTHDAGELSTRLADDVSKIQEGLGDKISNFFQWFSSFIVGIIIGFVYGWKLTLVCLSVSPLLAIAGGIMTYMISNATNKELSAYAKAGAIAEEVLTAIRTVTAFGGQEKECQRYNANLVDAKKMGIKKGMFAGLGMGVTFFFIFSSYALAFWYGGKLVREGEMQIGDMLIVFFCVIIGAFALGNAAPNLQSVGVARGAAYMIWELIDRVSLIDPCSPDGIALAPNELNGNLTLIDAFFNYPNRKDIKILQGMNLKIKRGQTVALVGPSGCGKSTVIQLIQRFYDLDMGELYIDKNPIKKLHLSTFRKMIGVVSQEPVLFGMTIAQNIAMGKDGASHEEIVNASKMANAHDFISDLPQKYDTMVGERGAQLSGGQKQRVAIARALIRNPAIILLDEATSALDTESEAIVQDALDKAREGRTTIVVAHRLSTIKTADIICGVKDGQVVEMGNHNELMELGGIYCQLVNNQKMKAGVLEDEEEEADEIDKKNQLIRKNSETEIVVVDPKDQKIKELDKEVSIIRVFSYNKPEWYFIVIGCIAAIIHGAIEPCFAIIFARFLGVFAETNPEIKEQRVLLYSLLFLVIAVCAGGSTFIQGTMFAISGERLTLRMRAMIFAKLLRKEISYFDDENNSVGALTTRLATDASAIQGATGVRIGMIMQCISALGTGIIIGFVYCWQLTLFILAFAPLIGIAGMLQMKIAKGFSGGNNDALEKAGKIASEAISNIRTVATLSKETYFIEEYKRHIYVPHKSNLRKAHIYGIAFSFSQSLIYFADACIFMLGAYLIEQRIINYQDMFTVFGAIIFSAMSLGQASQFAPDYAKAKISANRVFALLDNQQVVDVSSNEGEKPAKCEGLVEFSEVCFSYPTRPSVKVLQGLNLNVERGSTIALVGSSGCGKSTTVQLLERFYDVMEGSVMIDGIDVRKLNVNWLRLQLGLVSQEPILFDSSISYNISYGDNTRIVPLEEVQAAAKMANISTFIEGLPMGYETNVGDKGAQLSGGQKQRIAIARALLRNPKILLLDEATSALDTESEKIVQEALDKAQEGRTSIVIAHRLSTIQNAKCIFVFHKGVIIEQGNHEQLMSLKGKYYKLNMAQARKPT